MGEQTWHRPTLPDAVAVRTWGCHNGNQERRRCYNED